MISKYTSINKYGGHTWQVKIDSLLHLFIHTSDNKLCFIELKEWKFLWYRKLLAFSTDKGIESAIRDAFNKTYDFFYKNKDFNWSLDKKEELQSKLLIEVKKDSKKSRNVYPKIRTSGYYIAKHSGIGVYGNSFDIVIILFFNNKNRVYYLDNEGSYEMPKGEAQGIIEDFKDKLFSHYNYAEYHVDGNEIDMIFYKDKEKRFFAQLKGAIDGNKLKLDMINQSYDYATETTKVTTDLVGLNFQFKKC